jgi:hypothetical protein
VVRPPGFEPGFPAVSLLEWEAGVIDQTARQRLDRSEGWLWTTAAKGEPPDKVLVSLTYNAQCRFAGDNEADTRYTVKLDPRTAAIRLQCRD